MAKIYYKIIKRQDSTMTIEDVPALWRDKVQELLDADNNEQ